MNFIHISYFQGADFNQYNFKNVSSCFELSDVQINAVIVYSNLSIETIFPCIPTTSESEGRGGRLFKGWGVGGGTLF